MHEHGLEMIDGCSAAGGDEFDALEEEETRTVIDKEEEDEDAFDLMDPSEFLLSFLSSLFDCCRLWKRLYSSSWSLKLTLSHLPSPPPLSG